MTTSRSKKPDPPQRAAAEDQSLSGLAQAPDVWSDDAKAAETTVTMNRELAEGGEVLQLTAETVALEPSDTGNRAGEEVTEALLKPASRAGTASGTSRGSVVAAMAELSHDALLSAAHVVRIERGGYAIASPEEAMWHNELARHRQVINVVLGIVAVAMLVLPFLGGSTAIKSVLYVGLIALAAMSLWHRGLLAHPERVTHRSIDFIWMLAAVDTCLAVAFFGMFSPAPAIIALEILLVGLTGRRPLIAMCVGLLALFVTVVGVLIITGVCADPGLIHASYLDVSSQIFGQGLFMCVLVGALLLGLSTRREMVASLEKLHRAALLVAQHEAAVREVGQDLRRAANIGGRGPLTGRILGSFRLGVLIGRGGMGAVYQAAHIDSHDLAAVKVLHASAMAEPGAMARFAREVDVARTLDMPNIVRVLEVGDQDGVPYLAMEYLHGQDLARYLRKRNRLPLDKVVQLVREVGAGIHAAGQAGIVHRDIKPHNLFLVEPDERAADRRRTWKILDFGVATAASSSGTLTQGRIIGTPAYMAPEQARGLTVTHSADLYALASIVYRSLTGHPPFSGDDLPSLLYRVVHEMPRRPSRLADIPEAFDSVLAVGMAKEPDARFQSAEALADAVGEAVHGRVSAELAERADALVRVSPWR